MRVRIGLVILLLVFLFDSNNVVYAAKPTNRQIVLNWCRQFLHSCDGFLCGKRIKLGNEKLFINTLSSPYLDVQFYNSNMWNNLPLVGMGATTGMFYPPEALAFNNYRNRTAQLAIKIPDGQGPNLTLWHETLHAIIYMNGWRKHHCLDNDGDKEESYTWLNEERIKFLSNYVVGYDKLYRKAQQQIATAPISEVINVSTKLKNRMQLMNKNWLKERLQSGPTHPYRGKSIEQKEVKELDKLLGININFHQIKASYPPLVGPLTSVAHAGNFKFFVNSVEIKKQVQRAYCNPQNIKMEIRAQMTDSFFNSNPNSRRSPYYYKVGKTTYWVVDEDYRWKVATVPNTGVKLRTSRSSGRAAGANVKNDRAHLTWPTKKPGQIRLLVSCKRTWAINDGSGRGVVNKNTTSQGYIWLNCFPK